MGNSLKIIFFFSVNMYELIEERKDLIILSHWLLITCHE